VSESATIRERESGLVVCEFRCENVQSVAIDWSDSSVVVSFENGQTYERLEVSQEDLIATFNEVREQVFGSGLPSMPIIDDSLSDAQKEAILDALSKVPARQRGTVDGENVASPEFEARMAKSLSCHVWDLPDFLKSKRGERVITKILKSGGGDG
jgi:hypothetical protein